MKNENVEMGYVFSINKVLLGKKNTYIVIANHSVVSNSPCLLHSESFVLYSSILYTTCHLKVSIYVMGTPWIL